MADDFQKRMPSVERRISEIKQDDIRVSVIGTVLDRQGERLVVDDGSGKVTVSFEGEVQAEPGKIVRVLGRVMPMDTGIEIQGDVLQPMEGLDMKLKKRVESLAG